MALEGRVEAACFLLLFPGFCLCAFLYDSEAMSHCETVSHLSVFFSSFILGICDCDGK